MCPVCKLQADIAFVVDSSGSINDVDPNNWQRVLMFITNLIDKLEIGSDQIRVAAATFSNFGYMQFLFSNFNTSEGVKNAINNMEYKGGNTNTSGGLYIMLKDLFNEMNGDRPGVRDIAIVITDGVSTRDAHLTGPYANEAKQRGIKVAHHIL